MKHRLFKLALFLLLGAIVNVAVAWSSAMWFSQINTKLNPSFDGLSWDGKNYELWTTTRYETNGSLRVVSSWNYFNPDIPVITTGFVFRERSDFVPASFPSAESQVPNWAVFLRPDSIDQTEYGSYNFVVDARGWPLLSMWGGHKRIRTFFRFIESGAKRRSSESAEPIPIRAILLSFDEKPGRYSDHTSRFLPLSPLWLGFAINTIFYATILWLPFAPFQLRRYLRVKRNL